MTKTDPGSIAQTIPQSLSWRALREQVEHALAESQTEMQIASPVAEARWMLEEAAGRGDAELVLLGQEPVQALAVARIERMVVRRLTGEPLQYVLGRWSFLDFDLMVDERVLIPRPETEITARVAIEEAVRTGAPDLGEPEAAELVVADLGTGSGALAMALARELSEAQVWATDVSADALAVARANLAGIGTAATRVRLAQGDWFEALPSELRGQLQVVVSNPPYVAEGEVADLPPEVARHEPRAALVSGPTGFEAIEQLVTDVKAWLVSGGAFVCELAPHQSEAATTLARDAGFAKVLVRPDLTGRDRVLVARLA